MIISRKTIKDAGRLLSLAVLAVLAGGCMSFGSAERAEKTVPMAQRNLAQGWVASVEGDGLYARDQDFVRESDGVHVRVIGMVHIADASFYEGVNVECAKADLVLAEGVGGERAGLSAWNTMVGYILSSYDRVAYYSDACQQGRAFRAGPQSQPGDVDQSAMKKHGGEIRTELSAVLLTPVIALFLETSNALLWTDQHLARLLGRTTEHQAACRRLLLGGLDDEVLPEAGQAQVSTAAEDDEEDEDEDDILLPGILGLRNRHLIGELDKALAKKDKPRHVILPWGAAHGPGLAKLLQERGFSPAQTQWRRLSDYAMHPDRDEAPVQYMVPWCLRYVERDGDFEAAAVLDALFVARGRKGWVCHLGWTHLLSCGHSPQGTLVYIGPRLFGRPLLFERANGRTQALWGLIDTGD